MIPINGIADTPLTDWGADLANDLLGISGYLRGLADFIKHCETPMSIAIQGSWGTGKTSLMNALKEQLASTASGGETSEASGGETPETNSGKIKTVFFNTWQYSQFGTSDDLYASFVSRINADLVEQNPVNPERMKNIAGTLGKIAFSLLRSTAIGLTGDVVRLLTGEFMKQLEAWEKDAPNGSKWKAVLSFLTRLEPSEAGKRGQNQLDNIDSATPAEEKATLIEAMKETFSALIEEAAGQNGRVIIFVDDLDRLDSATAVGLLEVIKLFMDVPKCVFVLAVDYEVVVQGVRKKYGDPNMSARKCQQFFHKIIQLPFRMPVELYTIDEMFQKKFQDLNADQSLDFAVKAIVTLLWETQGANPREILRLYNYYVLYTYMPEKEKLFQYNYQKILLLVSLILQMNCPEAHQLLIDSVKNAGANRDKAEMLQEFLQAFDSSENTGAEQHAEAEQKTLEEAETEDALRALYRAFQQIAKGVNQSIGKIYEAFVSVLELATVTVLGENPEQTRKPPQRVDRISINFGKMWHTPFDHGTIDKTIDEEITSTLANDALKRTFEIILGNCEPTLASKFVSAYTGQDKIFTRDKNLDYGKFRSKKALDLEGYRDSPLYIATSTALFPVAGSQGCSTKTTQVDRLCEFMRENNVYVEVSWKYQNKEVYVWSFLRQTNQSP